MCKEGDFHLVEAEMLMVWLLVALSIYALVVVAGRAHSRYLDRQEARWKFDDASRVFVLWGSVVPCSSTGYVLLSDGDFVAFETTRVPDALKKIETRGELRLSRGWWSSISSNASYGRRL